MKYNAAEIIERLEQIRGSELTDTDRDEIAHWEKGRRLATTVQTEGWPIAIELLQNYVIASVEKLVATDPKDDSEVLINHVISFISSRLLQIFQQDVKRWVESSRVSPKAIKETYDSQQRIDL